MTWHRLIDVCFWLSIGAFSALLLLALTTAHAAAGPSDPEPVVFEMEPYRWTPEDVLQAMQDYGHPVSTIYRTEVGGVGFEPYAVGSYCELGPAQLGGKPCHIYPEGVRGPGWGLLNDYCRWATWHERSCDAHNPYLVADYIMWKAAEGRLRGGWWYL